MRVVAHPTPVVRLPAPGQRPLRHNVPMVENNQYQAEPLVSTQSPSIPVDSCGTLHGDRDRGRRRRGVQGSEPTDRPAVGAGAARSRSPRLPRGLLVCLVLLAVAAAAAAPGSRVGGLSRAAAAGHSGRRGFAGRLRLVHAGAHSGAAAVVDVPARERRPRVRRELRRLPRREGRGLRRPAAGAGRLRQPRRADGGAGRHQHAAVRGRAQRAATSTRSPSTSRRSSPTRRRARPRSLPGGDLYRLYCSGCHSSTGSGGAMAGRQQRAQHPRSTRRPRRSPP